MIARRQPFIARAIARAGFAVIIAAAVLPAVTQAQSIQTWGGGNGTWFANPGNWSSSDGSGLVWSNTGAPRAMFNAGSGTLTLNGSVALSVNSGTTANGAGMNFLESGTWTLASGSIAGRFWAFGTSGSSTIKLTLDNVTLRGSTAADLNAYNSSQVEVVLGNLSNSTTPLLSAVTGDVRFTVGATTNLGSIREFRPSQFNNGLGGGFSATGSSQLFSGTLGIAQYTFASNGHTFSAGSLANYSTSGSRTLTITGTGGIAASGTFLASFGTSHTVWTKAGTGFLSVDSLLTSGTQNFIVSEGSMLFNGSSTNLGNVNVASGAILGGTGSLSFAADRVLTGSAGSIFTADMTAGGLDIAGTLALAQTGSGVTLRLGGLIPTTGTTTLMSWTTLSTGSFTKITYNDTEVFPDIATPTLGGGKVSYTAVPNSIVFIAVPEPATVALIAGGAAILGGHVIHRRRRRAAKTPAPRRDS